MMLAAFASAMMRRQMPLLISMLLDYYAIDYATLRSLYALRRRFRHAAYCHATLIDAACAFRH